MSITQTFLQNNTSAPVRVHVLFSNNRTTLHNIPMSKYVFIDEQKAHASVTSVHFETKSPVSVRISPVSGAPIKFAAIYTAGSAAPPPATPPTPAWTPPTPAWNPWTKAQCPSLGFGYANGECAEDICQELSKMPSPSPFTDKFGTDSVAISRCVAWGNSVCGVGANCAGDGGTAGSDETPSWATTDQSSPF